MQCRYHKGEIVRLTNDLFYCVPLDNYNNAHEMYDGDFN